MRRVAAVLLAGACVLAAAVAVAGPQAVAASAPGRVRAVAASTVSAHTLTLSWRNPSSRSFARAQVRVAAGTRAPRTPRDGHRLGSVAASRHTFAVTNLRSATTYSFSVFATDGHGHYAAPATTRATTRLDAPRFPRAYEATAGTTVLWRNPPSGVRRVIVRYARGIAAPTSVRAGSGVRLPSATSHRVTLTSLAADTRYSVSIFAVDRSGRASAPAVTRFTTGVAPGAGPEPAVYSGRVVDSAGTPLAGALVAGYRLVGDHYDSVVATSAADGSYALQLLPGAWSVGAYGDTALGGNSDAGGYQLDYTDVTIASPAPVAAADLVLLPGAAVHGTVTDVRGRGLEGAVASVQLVSPYVTEGGFGLAFGDAGSDEGVTDADGNWTLRGLDPTQPVRVCAYGEGLAGAGGGAATDYLSTCSSRATYLSADALASTPDLALTRADGGVVTGQLTGVDGHPVSTGVSLDPVGDGFGFGDYLGSDVDGSFRFAAVAPGRYRICADGASAVPGGSRTGYAPACSASIVTVGTGTVRADDLVLELGAAVSGVLTGPSGRPVAGAQVQIAPPGDDDEGYYAYASTDQDGRWSASGLDNASHVACFDGTAVTGIATGVASSCWRDRADFRLSKGHTRTGIDHRVGAAGAVTGRVVDSDGNPLPGSFVALSTFDPFGEGGESGAYAISDAEGRYSLIGLSAGTKKICVGATTGDGFEVSGCRAGVRVRIGRTTAGVDLVAPAATGIEVRVRDASGNPVAAVDAAGLAACDPDEDDCVATPLLGRSQVVVDGSAMTDAAGVARLDVGGAGRYAVCLFAYFGTTVSGGSPTGYADACHGGTAYDVTVVRGTVTTLDMTLAAGGAVAGTVTDTSGAPVAGARLVIPGSAADDTPQFPDDAIDDPFASLDDPDGPGGGSVTDADGRYEVIGVRPGSWTVCARTDGVTGRAGGLLPRCVGATKDGATGGSRVAVTAGAVTGPVDLRLNPGAELTGRVTARGKPAPAAVVLVFTGRGLDDLRVASPTATGHWSVDGLPAGSYTVCAGDKSGGQCFRKVAWSNTDEAPPLRRATLVTVATGGRRTGIDLALAR